MEILEQTEIQEKRQELSEKFNDLKENQDRLMQFLSLLEKITSWSYGKSFFSIYPVPYTLENMGFTTPEILKNTYETLEDANENEVYSFGFIDGKHVITISPSEGIKRVLANFFIEENNRIMRYSIYYNSVDLKENQLVFNAESDVTLEVLQHFWELTPKIYISASINNREDFQAGYYFYDNDKLSSTIIAHLKRSGTSLPQSTYNYAYDNKGNLKTVTSQYSGAIIWKKGQKK